jgi:hypothetical protein
MKKILLIPFVCLVFFVKAQLPYTQGVFSYDSLINVVYGTAIDYAGNTDTLKMDIFRPIGDSNCLRPIIVLVHGGSWIGGSKEDPDLVYMSRNLASRGWVVANINYRLGTHKTQSYSMYALCNTNISQPCAYISDSSEIYRANFRGMQDAKGAIRFMKNRQAIDSSDIYNVFIAGESAGGFISFAAAYTDKLSEKSPDCYSIPDAQLSDPGLATYGCIPSPISYSRPDLGDIDGSLNTGTYDASVKGIGNFYGGVFSLDMFQQNTYKPDVYMFHQGSDVIVHYNYGQILGRISWECYAQTNLCQSYYYYPPAFGSDSIAKYFNSIVPYQPIYQSEIVNNYAYLNNCVSNGHAIDNIQIRLQNMVDFFANTIFTTGNNPAINCQHVSLNSVHENDRIKIFSNPAHNYLSFSVRPEMIGSNFVLTNQMGGIAMKGKITSVENSFDIRELNAGSYLLSIGTYLPQKIVVVKY